MDPAVFVRIQAQRVVRDHAPYAKRAGRPNQNHALARLAVCGRCGGRMGSFTSSYRRKSDGGRKRFYRCLTAHDGSGDCDAIHPIDAETVDAAVIDGLDTLLIDFEQWRQRIEDGYDTERDRLVLEVERAQADHDAQAAKLIKVEAKWSEYVAAGDDERAENVEPMVKRDRQAATDAEHRLKAAQDALSAVPTEAPTDAMLDFGNALQEALKGRVDRSAPMVQVNEALRGMFACFTIQELPHEDGPNPFRWGGILIQPWLKPGALIPPSDDPELGWAWPRLVKATDDPPPMRWLRPEQNVQDPQAYLRMKLKRRWLAASHG